MNKWLKGNGYWCSSCRGTGVGAITDYIEYENGTFCAFRESCRTCNGTRRLAATEAQAIAGDVPKTPDPDELTSFTNIIEYGTLTKTGRLPRSARRANRSYG